MATIINAATSGGLIQSADTSGILEIQTGGVTAMTVSAAQVVTFVNAPVGVEAFAAGTVMMFVQTAAPTGWTKSTAHDNKALRVVSGTASSGGTVAFTTAFASQGVSGTNQGTTLATSQIPSHTHAAGTYAISTTTALTGNVGYRAVSGTGGSTGPFTQTGEPNFYQNAASYGTVRVAMNVNHNHTLSGSSGSEGGGTSHTHTFTGTAIDLAVQYVDVIIATKN